MSERPSPLDAGLDYVTELPGFSRGNPSYLDGRAVDWLFDALLNLTGEVWVNRDRMMIVEHLLATEGVVTPERIEAFRPDAAMKAQMSEARRELVSRVFAKLYENLDGLGPAKFQSGVVKD